MCWSETATLSMVGLGTAATIVAARRGEPKAIWLTMGYFTAMEVLQAAGYRVVDQCGSPVNQSVTVLSYLHIAFQPLFINAFAMALVGDQVTPRMRRAVYGLAGLATALLLLRLVPMEWAGLCRPGDALCGPEFCTISGDWHLGWQMPINDMWRAMLPFLDTFGQFPAYMLAAFLLPLIYGAWRFVVLHALTGPILAAIITDNGNEMPAVWCLFSIGILIIGLSPMIRRQFAPRAASEPA